MTFRIDATASADAFRLEVQGLVDAAALEAIREAIREGRAGPLRLVLKQGCQVEPAILPVLRSLEGIELVAESPFLARWLGRI